MKENNVGAHVALRITTHGRAVYMYKSTEFLEEDKLIPTIEGVLRVFDRYGERTKRAKARLKFLVKDLGLEAFLALVAEERQAFAYQTYSIDTSNFEQPIVF